MAAGQITAHDGVTIQFDGTSTALSAEPMSLITGKYYRVTDSAKRCLDPRVALVIRDNGVNMVAGTNIESIDYLHGIVKFAAAYTVIGPVTVHTGNYIPLSTFAYASSFSFNISRTKLDKTVFGNQFRRYLLGLADVSGDFGSFSNLLDVVGIEALGTSLNSATLRVLSVVLAQDGASVANGGVVVRALVNVNSSADKATPDGLVENGANFVGKAMMSTAGASGSWGVAYSILDGATGLPFGV